MEVPFLDLSAQLRDVEADVRAGIDRVLASQQFILGNEGRQLEAEIAAYTGRRHAVGVSSGTDALIATLLAMGIGTGDEVVTTPFTFVATATAIARTGARAVFVDIDPDTYALDPARLAAVIGAHTRAIIPVHLFGQLADMNAIHAAARDVPVVEDAAQSLGAIRDSRHVGAGSLAAALSFFPSKNLGAMGDAGMILTDDEAFATKLRCLRNHGQEPKYVCRMVGGNFRLDELQAAILRAKLPRLDAWILRRQENARLYRAAFDAVHVPSLELPPEALDVRHTYHQFVVRTPHRDALRGHLEARGVATAVYYPVPLHLQPAFASWGYRASDFPEAERAARETLALPIHPWLSSDAIAYVVDSIAGFFRARG